ncbi:MAG TPA: hypothetical protein VFQ23_10370 [Anaerolineales bacterium]|nr:hypothetical protein [Anaerolineales bacterium]
MPNPYFNIMPNQVAGAAPPSAISVPQATLTFAGAPAAVTIVVKVLSVAFPSSTLATNPQTLLVGLSLLVGLLIYWSTAPTGQNTKDKVLGVVFALINSFAIAAATLGIETAAVLIK